ncbi:asparagine synthase [bacterium]|nr:MAG: asparagine synthase [bacterium]RIK64357.1 MAG: hypothetical protein DCC64_04270 [Planctomycetota bacterium]
MRVPVKDFFLRCRPGESPYFEAGGASYGPQRQDIEHAVVHVAPGHVELGTDAFASRPVHVLARDGSLWAAASLRRLTREADVPRHLLPMGVAVALCEPVGRRPSLCAGGLSLLPGTALVWEEGKTRTTRQRARTRAAMADPEELVEVLRRAVLKRVGQGHGALALSGGLDSVALLALLAQAGVPVRAYTLADAASSDEVAAAAVWAGRFGASHRVIEISESELPPLAEATIRACECVIYNARAMSKFAFHREVARHETHLLSGFGADDLLMGSPAGLTLEAGVPRFVLEREPERELGRFLLKREWSRRLRPAEFGVQQGAAGARELMLETVMAHSGLPVETLTGLAHGLDVRMPYLDSEFAALALALQPAHLMRDNLGKHLLRQAMVSRLGADFCFAPKKARLAPPGGGNVRARRDWIAWLDAALSHDRLERLQVVDEGKVRRELIQYGKLHNDAPRRLLLDRVLMRLASLTVLQQWWEGP